jgi:hypothetical protein
MRSYRKKRNIIERNSKKKRRIRKKNFTKKKILKRKIFKTTLSIKPMNCSPAVNGKTPIENSCLTPDILIKIKNEYNKDHPFNMILTKDPREIWKILNERLIKEKGCKKEKCWLDQIDDNNLRNQIQEFIFAPEQPKEWQNNPDEWLSNYDIFNVIRQYEDTYKDFKFMGPTTIDFDTRLPEKNNECVENEICEFDLKKDIKKGIEHFACVFNLDKRNQSGSHWVSMFIDIPEKIIVYFDSAGARDIPDEIDNLVKRIQYQAANDLDIPFQFEYLCNSKVKHQQGGTECGMYAIFFIITMLTGKTPFMKDKQMNMKERLELFLEKRIPDEVVFDYRDLYFNKKE